MKKIFSLILCIVVISTYTPIFASNSVDDALLNAAEYLYKQTPDPAPAQTGGEWAILGLLKSGIKINADYYEKYYTNLCKKLSENNGILSKSKNTEYSRAILVLNAIGKNPENVCGYNLITPLTDFKKTVRQGINGAVWALIALNSYNDKIYPDLKKAYVDFVLSRQLEDGGWALNSASSSPDADITAMVLCALAEYKKDTKAEIAITKALLCLGELQQTDGGFTSAGIPTCESTAQVIIALCELGIDLDDPRFVKNGNTVLDSLLSYYSPNKHFLHTKDSNQTDLMATEQGLLAICAAKNAQQSGKSLFYSNKASHIYGQILPQDVLYLIRNVFKKELI